MFDARKHKIFRIITYILREVNEEFIFINLNILILFDVKMNWIEK